MECQSQRGHCACRWWTTVEFIASSWNSAEAAVDTLREGRDLAMDGSWGIEPRKLSRRALVMPTSHSHIVLMSEEQPSLIVRKAPHAPVWSAWAIIEGRPSEEIFEGISEEEALNWIKTSGDSWIAERLRKRSDWTTSGGHDGERRSEGQ
jgi:hypothetical protein